MHPPTLAPGMKSHRRVTSVEATARADGISTETKTVRVRVEFAGPLADMDAATRAGIVAAAACPADARFMRTGGRIVYGAGPSCSYEYRGLVVREGFTPPADATEANPRPSRSSAPRPSSGLTHGRRRLYGSLPKAAERKP